MRAHLDGQLTCPGSHREHIVMLYRTQVSASSHPRVLFSALAARASLGLSFPICRMKESECITF